MSLTSIILNTTLWNPSNASDDNNGEIMTTITNEKINFRGQIPSTFGNIINMQWLSLG